MFYNIDGTREKLIIVGTGTVARLAYHYFTIDSDYDVYAFCVEETSSETDSLFSLPVLALSEAFSRFPANEYTFFVAPDTEDTVFRQELFQRVKEQGYALAFYVSSQATIMNGGKVGENTCVMEGAILQPFSAIGSNVLIWSGAIIGAEAVVHDHCLLSSGSIAGSWSVVGELATLGEKSVLLPGGHIPRGTAVPAGSICCSGEAVYAQCASEAAV